jgi:hypothetical protein
MPRRILALIVFLVAAPTPQASDLMVFGDSFGQGSVRGAGGECFVITALHVV